MLSYRHAFHAGNYADILKHTTLVFILESLLKKDKPFTVIDTHAGAGFYNLSDDMALKTGEAQSGIYLLLKKISENSNPKEIPLNLQPYLNQTQKFTSEGKYPGSPAISLGFLRKTDNLILMELHNTEIEILKTNMQFLLSHEINGEKTSSTEKAKVEIHHRNAYEGLCAIVPPQTKRGLVLMDPSYETNEDWFNVGKSIEAAHKKWQIGIFAIWYPLLEHRRYEISTLKNTLISIAQNFPQSSKVEKQDSHILFTELCTENTTEAGRLYGSGMCVINPPYMLGEKLETVLPYLAESSGPNSSWALSTSLE